MTDNETPDNVSLFPGVDHITPPGEPLKTLSPESEFLGNIGSFNVTDIIANSALMADILAAMRFVPYSVVFDYSKSAFVYSGYSKLFSKKKNLYGLTPHYDLTIHGTGTPQFTVSAKIVGAN